MRMNSLSELQPNEAIKMCILLMGAF